MSGPRRWVQVAATRLPGGERTLVLLQDVTDLRRAEAARRDFVANVSHELRTPVAALKALVETLEAGALEDPEAGPDFLRRMHVEVDGLAQLVAELLELARAEAGKLELELAPCQPGELVKEAVERTRPYAERPGSHRQRARPRAGDLQARRASARRVDLGGERRPGPGRHLPLHRAPGEGEPRAEIVMPAALYRTSVL